jgi:hypothetical protein
MPLPNFLVIGAPRANTQWISQCLSEHPEIALPPEEVYFFTRRRVVMSNWYKGVDWYSDLLSQNIQKETKTCGEVTPIYLFDDDTPELIYQTVPNVKLIISLRDQSARAYSWYRLFLRFNPEIYHTDYSYKKFLTYQNDVYGREGFYLEHIKRYLNFFPRESMLILLHDDLQADSATYVRRIYQFLEVDADFRPPSLNHRLNKMELNLYRSRLLHKFSNRLKYSSKLKKMHLDGFVNAIERVNTIPVKRSEFTRKHRLDPEMKRRMAQLYYEHNQELGDFLGRDLSHWNT